VSRKRCQVALVTPLRPPLGTDAVERTEATLDLVGRELDRWRRVAYAVRKLGSGYAACSEL
jgi:hypothetical protein